MDSINYSNYNKIYNTYEKYFGRDSFNVAFDNYINVSNFKDLVKGIVRSNIKNRIAWKNYFDYPFFK